MNNTRSFGSVMHGLLDTAAQIVEKPIANVLNDAGSFVGLNSLGDDIVSPVMNGVHDAITGSSSGIGNDLRMGPSSATAPDSQVRTGETTFAGAAGGSDQVRGITNFGGEAIESVSVANVDQVNVSTESIESLRAFFKRPRKITVPPGGTGAVFNFNEYFSSEPVKSKLSQYSGCRFTLCFRLHSNYSPVDSGFALYSILPLPPETINTFDSTSVTSYRLGVISNAPHVYHNFNEVDSTELKLPYCHPFRFLDNRQLIKDSSRLFNVRWTRWFFNALDELGAYGYVWLEDLDLFYPTYFLPVTEGPEHHSHLSSSVITQNANSIDDVAHAPGIAKPQSLTSITRKIVSPHSDSWLDYFRTMTMVGLNYIEVGTDFRKSLEVFPLGFSQDFGPSKLSVAGMLFKYWRGSIDYKFSIVKSKFHNGRFQFGFVPHVSRAQLLPDWETNEDLWGNIYSEIWNIRDSSEFTFSCPYRLSEFSAHREGVSGTLIIRTVTPLTAPDNVSPRVVFLTSVAAGKDFEVCRFQLLKDILKYPDGRNAFFYNFSPTATPPARIPVSEGLATSSEESFPVFVNDGSLTLSQSSAVPSRPGFAVNGFDLITDDYDIWTSEAFIPTYAQVDGAAYFANEVNSSSLIASLFLGTLCDPYFKLADADQITVPYGSPHSSKDYTFPYTCNLSYLPYFLSSGILKADQKINDRPVQVLDQSANQNAQFCFPFLPPPRITFYKV